MPTYLEILLTLLLAVPWGIVVIGGVLAMDKGRQTCHNRGSASYRGH